MQVTACIGGIFYSAIYSAMQNCRRQTSQTFPSSVHDPVKWNKLSIWLLTDDWELIPFRCQFAVSLVTTLSIDSSQDRTLPFDLPVKKHSTHSWSTWNLFLDSWILWFFPGSFWIFGFCLGFLKSLVSFPGSFWIFGFSPGFLKSLVSFPGSFWIFGICLGFLKSLDLAFDF